MSGQAIVLSLLKADATLVAQIPTARMSCGKLPLGVAMPAILITKIDSIPRLTVAMTKGAARLHTERIQVTVFVKDVDASPAGEGYPKLDSLMTLVLAACPNTKGATVTGAVVDSVLPDIEGPDLPDPAVGLYSRSRDFIVKYTA